MHVQGKLIDMRDEGAKQGPEGLIAWALDGVETGTVTGSTTCVSAPGTGLLCASNEKLWHALIYAFQPNRENV